MFEYFAAAKTASNVQGSCFNFNCNLQFSSLRDRLPTSLNVFCCLLLRLTFTTRVSAISCICTRIFI